MRPGSVQTGSPEPVRASGTPSAASEILLSFIWFSNRLLRAFQRRNTNSKCSPFIFHRKDLLRVKITLLWASSNVMGREGTGVRLSLG